MSPINNCNSLALINFPHINHTIIVFQVLRAFRVLRLFGRLKNLRNIVTAISSSIIPVLNAFIIIYLVASICSAPQSLLS